MFPLIECYYYYFIVCFVVCGEGEILINISINPATGLNNNLLLCWFASHQRQLYLCLLADSNLVTDAYFVLYCCCDLYVCPYTAPTFTKLYS